MTTAMTFGTGPGGAPGWAWRVDDTRWRIAGSTSSSPLHNEFSAIVDVLAALGDAAGGVRVLVQHEALERLLAVADRSDARLGLEALGVAEADLERLDRVEKSRIEFAAAGAQAIHPGDGEPFESTDASDDLRRTIIDLETVMLSAEGRSDERALEEMIHYDFYEIGRSGRYWQRDEVISTLLTIPHQVRRVTFDRVVELAPGVVHVRFRTEDAVGIVHRSSIWMREGGRWRQRYHQGTPDTQQRRGSAQLVEEPSGLA